LQFATTEDELIEASKKIFDEDFKQFVFKYYDGDEFSGELITDSISPELIAKLNSDDENPIGFIGTESSEYYKQLKDAGKNVVVIDPLQVQGREFDYVVIDKDWKLNLDDSDFAKKGRNLVYFMKDLYTMISRSRQGTILIDRGLSKFISNIQDEFTGKANDIKPAIEKFR
jgi:hypothetical protein